MNVVAGALRAVAEAADPVRIAPLGAVAATLLGAVALPLIDFIAGGPDASGRSAS